MTTEIRRPSTNAAPLAGHWQQYAACAETDPELFFPTGNKHEIAYQTEMAKRVCAGCPVRLRCLDWATSEDTEQRAGVWGGLSEDERRFYFRDETWATGEAVSQCLDRRAWIEAELADGTSQEAIARDLGVSRPVLRKAISLFPTEPAAGAAPEGVAA